MNKKNHILKIEQWIKAHDQGAIPKMGRSALYTASKNKGLVICFHGYTVAPWQFIPLAEVLFEQGFDVFIPRLPGHGRPHAEHIPRATSAQNLLGFIGDMRELIADASAPIYCIGLSAGGAIALRMAACSPNITGCVTMSPFFAPHDARSKKAIALISKLQASPIPIITPFLKRYLLNKTIALTAPTPLSKDLTHVNALTVSQILSLYRFGMETMKHLHRIQCPVLMFRSDADTRSSQHHMLECESILSKTLAKTLSEPLGKSLAKTSTETSAKTQAETLGKTVANASAETSGVAFKSVIFNNNEHVPHAMIHPKQNLNTRALQTIWEQIREFLSN